MTKPQDTKTQDTYTGFIASVVLALIGSGWLADGIVAPLSGFLSEASLALWRGNLATGLFFAISIADPVGMLINKTSPRRILVRFAGGFFFGTAAFLLILAPLAGAGMSTFLQLILLVLYIPFRALAHKVSATLADHAIDPAKMLASAVLGFARWPDRFLFIMFMSISFVAFWAYTPSLQVTLIVLAIWLTLVTALIATRSYNEDEPNKAEADFKAWLALDGEESKTEKPIARAMDELGKIIRIVIPGAVLFGGMTCFAVQTLMALSPDIAANLADPDAMAGAIGIIAVSILGIVFASMLTGLLFGLILLQITAKIFHWSGYHHRENCFHLLRTMRFRPLVRAP
ncbi:MAG: hypothetical protein KUG58_01350 [Marinosulfonomonas sp.]|nr:hypothetical protein [Marinosulfonomonas sp.]